MGLGADQIMTQMKALGIDITREEVSAWGGGGRFDSLHLIG